MNKGMQIILFTITALVLLTTAPTIYGGQYYTYSYIVFNSPALTAFNNTIVFKHSVYFTDTGTLIPVSGEIIRAYRYGGQLIIITKKNQYAPYTFYTVSPDKGVEYLAEAEGTLVDYGVFSGNKVAYYLGGKIVTTTITLPEKYTPVSFRIINGEPVALVKSGNKYYLSFIDYMLPIQDCRTAYLGEKLFVATDSGVEAYRVDTVDRRIVPDKYYAVNMLVDEIITQQESYLYMRATGHLAVLNLYTGKVTLFGSGVPAYMGVYDPTTDTTHLLTGEKVPGKTVFVDNNYVLTVVRNETILYPTKLSILKLYVPVEAVLHLLGLDIKLHLEPGIYHLPEGSLLEISDKTLFLKGEVTYPETKEARITTSVQNHIVIYMPPPPIELGELHGVIDVDSYMGRALIVTKHAAYVYTCLGLETSIQSSEELVKGSITSNYIALLSKDNIIRIYTVLGEKVGETYSPIPWSDIRKIYIENPSTLYLVTIYGTYMYSPGTGALSRVANITYNLGWAVVQYHPAVGTPGSTNIDRTAIETHNTTYYFSDAFPTLSSTAVVVNYGGTYIYIVLPDSTILVEGVLHEYTFYPITDKIMIAYEKEENEAKIIDVSPWYTYSNGYIIYAGRGAEIRVNGVRTPGSTALVLARTGTAVSVEVRKPYYETWYKTLVVHEGIETIHVELTPVLARVKIDVEAPANTNISRAELLIDGKEYNVSVGSTIELLANKPYTITLLHTYPYDVCKPYTVTTVFPQGPAQLRIKCRVKAPVLVLHTLVPVRVRIERVGEYNVTRETTVTLPSTGNYTLYITPLARGYSNKTIYVYAENNTVIPVDVTPPRLSILTIDAEPPTASIEVLSETNKLVTAGTGHLEVELPPGTYTVHVYAPGYTSYEDTVVIGPGERQHLTVKLTPETATTAQPAGQPTAETMIIAVVAATIVAATVFLLIRRRKNIEWILQKLRKKHSHEEEFGEES